MDEQKTTGSGSFLGNPNTLLALVTVFGGLWLVSKKLTSDRPVAPPGDAREFIGDQQFEARLWEDPFKTIATRGQEANGDGISPITAELGALAEQIKRRSVGPDNSPRSVLLLPVLITGGEYSEDLEARIRSRYAIVSALGQSGYVSEDPEHIGALKIPWLTTQEVEWAKQDGTPAKIKELWHGGSQAWAPQISLLGVNITSHPAQMDVRYEWYNPRTFSAGFARHGDEYSSVLILWLDEDYFADAPLLRLPLLLEQLINLQGVPSPKVALIGPRSSSTLRSMLPNWETGKSPWSDVKNENLSSLAQNVVKKIDLYCATSSAMDEVLVNLQMDSDPEPRATVRSKLLDVGFHSFHNLACTDAQMANQIFSELDLRHVRLWKKNTSKSPLDHVVLISEWDTFYARMFYLTYAAELAERQHWANSRAAFVRAFMSPIKPEPLENLDSFTYLRGLDGQTVITSAGSPEIGVDNAHAERSRLDSVDDLRHWTPDVNKAEGQGQFDYLGRLGDRIAELQRSLRRDSGSEIKAIGIVGSDVYDKLLILQALRPRFPNALFFTTDLDVRLLHPFERDWTRNLLVASSYGLALDPQLQGTIAPFRDSEQTAQFAAALAALGNSDLAGIRTVPPRRFEVGNRTAVDISVEDGSVISGEPGFKSFRLHPIALGEKGTDKYDFKRLWWSLFAAALLFAGASRYWDPLRRLTWDALAYPCKALEYSEEDIGGPDGAEALLHRLDDNLKSEIVQWLVNNPRIREIRERLTWQQAVKPHDVGSSREQTLIELTGVLVSLLNQQLLSEPAKRDGSEAVIETFKRPAAGNDCVRSILNLLPPTRRMLRRLDIRRNVDAFLDQIASPNEHHHSATSDSKASHRKGLRGYLLLPLTGARRFATRALDVVLGDIKPSRSALERRLDDIGEAALQAGVAAREASERIFMMRARRLICSWANFFIFGLLAIFMVRVIWRETFNTKGGEPFSLTSGTSAWPAEVLRMLVFVLAVCFGIGLLLKMREAFLTMTRKFRLSLPEFCTTDFPGRVCAESIWKDYCKASRFRMRFKRICLFVVSYFLLLLAIGFASGVPMFYPGRGLSIGYWNTASLLLSFFGFLILAFFTADAAFLCRDFIRKLGAGPTVYPLATRRYFSRQMGRIDDEYLDEWIDLQLIAELTEQVDRLVYYPAGLVLLLVLARNSWWDCWTWPISLIVVYAMNFFLALVSVVILQRAAKQAKLIAELSLSAKVRKLQADVAPSAAVNNANQAEKLLEDIRTLDRGAFVPFWENPVVGAIFLSSGGTTLLQMFIWFVDR